MFRPVAGVSLPLLSWAALAEQSGKLVLLWHITALQQEKQTQKRLRHQKNNNPNSQVLMQIVTCSHVLLHVDWIWPISGLLSSPAQVLLRETSWLKPLQFGDRWIRGLLVFPSCLKAKLGWHSHMHIHTNHLSMIKQKTLKVWDGCIQSMGELTSHRTV